MPAVRIRITPQGVSRGRAIIDTWGVCPLAIGELWEDELLSATVDLQEEVLRRWHQRVYKNETNVSARSEPAHVRYRPIADLGSQRTMRLRLHFSLASARKSRSPACRNRKNEEVQKNYRKP